MTSQTYAKLCLDSRMHEAIEPQTRSEKNGVALRFGITRRFGLRIPDSEAEEEVARREHRVDLELVETRSFSSRVVYLRYRVAR